MLSLQLYYVSIYVLKKSFTGYHRKKNVSITFHEYKLPKADFNCAYDSFQLNNVKYIKICLENIKKEYRNSRKIDVLPTMDLLGFIKEKKMYILTNKKDKFQLKKFGAACP